MVRRDYSECEIEGCGRGTTGTIGGIHVCERCRRDWESARPWGAVYFGGRWHGVRGATYGADVVAALPGVELSRGAQ